MDIDIEMSFWSFRRFGEWWLMQQKQRTQLVTLFLFLPYHLRLDSNFCTILFIFSHGKNFWQEKSMIREPSLS